MSSNIYQYRETLSLFVNLIKTTAASAKTIFNGILPVGTNSFSFLETQIAPGGSYTSPIGATQVVAIFCDGSLAITFKNVNGNTTVQQWTTTVNSVMVIPGEVDTFTITNNGTNTVNASILIV
jgi:hypothetical protein